jgi:hypothetical protein
VFSSHHAALITLPTLLRSPFAALLQQMTAGLGWIDFNTWTRADAHWYADLVAQSEGSEGCTVDNMESVLADVNSRPWTECICLAGDMVTWYTDTVGKKWGDDAHRRYSTTTKPKIMLAHELTLLRYQRVCEPLEKACHICGNCNCIRLEHNRYQSADEDKADRDHHSHCGLCSIRPELLAQFPETP